jgi:hypothetical protein
MTNGANYKRGKSHDSPWHSDIRTSNQLNTSPGWLSHPFQSETGNKGEEEPIKHRGSPRNKRTQSIYLLADGIADASSNSNAISLTIPERTEAISERSEAMSEAIANSTPEAIPKSNSHHSHRCTLLQEGGLQQWLCEAVGKHLSSRYIAPVNLSISSHICSKMVLRRNVCNCSSVTGRVGRR